MIDMNNFIPPNPDDPRIVLAKAEEKRRKVQMENKKEEDNCMVDVKEKIKEMEGQEMREIMQVCHNSMHINKYFEPSISHFSFFKLTDSVIGIKMDNLI